MIVSKNIYLTDDDADDHDLFLLALQEICTDCKLSLASSGDELLKRLEKLTFRLPDVIFLDINMPRKDGIKTLKEIKADPLLLKVPVIIYSTSTNPKYIVQAKENGASHYFVKPSDFPRLILLLKKALSINWLESDDQSTVPDFMIV